MERIWGKLIVLTLCVVSLGCAEVRPSHQLPLQDGDRARLDYYRSHSIQAVSDGTVTINGQVYGAKDPNNGLCYEDESGALISYVPATAASTQIVKAWFIPLGATLVGAAIGGFFGILTTFDPGNENNPGSFAAVGGGLGLLLGSTAAVIMSHQIPDMVRDKNDRKMKRYNRDLWRDLRLGMAPLGQGEALVMKTSF
jgi:hypothetical protein